MRPPGDAIRPLPTAVTRAIGLATLLATCAATAYSAAAWAAGARLPDHVLAIAGPDTVTTSDLERERAAAAAEPGGAASVADLVERLVNRAVLLRAAGTPTGAWTPEDSASYRTLRDRLLLGATLTAALDEARSAAIASGAGTLDDETIGLAARDSAVARAGASFDAPLLERLAAAWAALPRPHPDSSIAAQLRILAAVPSLAPADSARTLVRSRAGDVSVGDLTDAWRRLAPALRPRIETASQLRDFADNLVFERALRQRGETGGLERSPEVARALTEARERISLERYLTREVFAGLDADSATLRRHYDARPQAWALPRRVRALRLEFGTRAEASAMAERLMDAEGAERIESEARRGGVSYRVEVSAGQDPAFVAAAERAGAGGVAGPEHGPGGWWVARIEAFVPVTRRDFDDARGDVARDWRAREAERRTRVLCDRLRKRAGVRMHRAAIERLGQNPR